MSDDLQRSEEWFKKRLGKFTGSRFVDVLATSKKGDKKLKAYDELIWDLATERITGQVDHSLDSYALRWGRDLEEYARQEYELLTGEVVHQVDFIDHPTIANVGCSPDGLVGDDGGLEMKCPKDSRIHLQRFDDGVPEEYKPQIQGCLWVTSRAWWDFVSYDPRMPEHLRLLRIRVERDEAFIENLAKEVAAAEVAVSAIVDRFKK
jgi:predicted phage-related endonuclease